jgi:NADPH2:quinone reductase
LIARAAGELPTVPHVVGYLSAGTVSEVAGGVQDRTVGDRVVALNAAGSHAARRAVPAAMTWPIPTGLDAARAACVPVAFGTAYECLFTAGELAEGQTVLIHAGAGGVGMAAIQLANHAGATVIATASTDEKLDRLKALGLDHAINYATESFVTRANQLTNSNGVDLVIDSIGGQNLVDSVSVLAYRGTLVSVGTAARAGSAIDARSLWTRNNTLRGVSLAGAILPDYARIHPMIGDMLQRVASGKLSVERSRIPARERCWGPPVRRKPHRVRQDHHHPLTCPGSIAPLDRSSSRPVLATRTRCSRRRSCSWRFARPA